MLSWLDNKVLLAPMAGVTDPVFRHICRRMGAGLVFTEMVSAKGLFYASSNTSGLLSSPYDESPVAVQLFGHEPEIMEQMCRSPLLERFDVIDLNMGCPMPKIVNNGDGSALMRNPELASRVIRAAVASGKPVTVKFRAGWDEKSINAVEFGQMCAESGAAAITVHGRTREQLYGGIADRGIIARVKQAVSIPVVGNGDIFAPEDALNMIKETGCDAVMVARGIRGNPWLISQIQSLLRGEQYTLPTLYERTEVGLEHLDGLIALHGQRGAVLEMRKHFAWYISTFPGCASKRAAFMECRTADEMRRVVSQIRNEL